MKRLVWVLVAVLCAATTVYAAPSRDLNTVQDWQIGATKLQWFVPVEWPQTAQMRRIIASPVSSEREFYDNVAPNPYPPEASPWGGFASWGAIRGTITNLWYIDGTPGPDLNGFEVKAEVTNDLYAYPGVLGGTSAMNRHWQSAPDISGQQPGSMYEVRLATEFADDGPATLLNLPTVFPFGPESNIITGFYEYLSWYSFTSMEPPAFPFVPPGGYWVPTFSMTGPLAQDPLIGTPDVIEPGDTHYRLIPFGLRTALPPGDPLRTWLEAAKANGYDLFQNRAGSWNLKIPYYPGPTAYRDIGLPDDTGTVSVFYNTEPPPKDWGDAPDPTYPTLAASGGASHVIVPHMFLGAGIDGEPDGQPDANAMGDDNNGIDDEDGVRFTSLLVPGGNATVQVIASVSGMLDAWADFNGDGDWGDAGEQIFTSQQLLGGVNTLSFLVPATYKPGTRVFARFRFSTTGGLPFTGPAYDGEVEDYIITGQEEPIENDLGDAPDSSNSYPLSPMTAYPGVTANYPSVYRAGSPPFGPIHWRPTAVAYLGASVTLENEADIGADQDPTNNIIPLVNTADLDLRDDGVLLPLSLPNVTLTTFNYGVTVVSQQPNVLLFVNVWFDWNRDGDWDDIIQLPGGQIVQEWAVQNQNLGSPAPGVYTVTTPPFLPWHPAVAPMMPIWTRVTLSDQQWNPSGLPGDGGSGPMGGYVFGETEDYCFTPDPGPQDFGDAPDPTYPTLRASNGAQHTIVPGMFLGTTIDAELDGQPEAQALGDDVNGVPNDEDGMRNLSMLTPGQPGFFNVVASVPGMLDIWIDFDRDGVWQPAEQIAASLPVQGPVTPVNFAVPPTAKPGFTFARLRYSRQGGLQPTGPAPDGEVEDYQLRIRDPIKWIQEPDLTPLGVDVNATDNYILADDFQCTTTGRITDIHIWGSWRGDIFHRNGPRGLGFILSIHEDIPAGPGVPFSRPGKVLWKGEFPQVSYDCLHVATVPQGEGWLDPPSGYVYPGDTMVFRYDFDLDKPWLEPFIQCGTREKPVTYWLDVQHLTIDTPPPAPVFGWKTSTRHWNDDAVWGLGAEPFEGPWNELRYPKGHQMEGQSIDLAFAITGQDLSADWGDAPDPKYPTLSASGGASHTIVPGFCLGQFVDGEPDGQPDPSATGDDNNGVPDDEDGVVFVTPFVPWKYAVARITASANGLVDAWYDSDADGDWTDPSEQICASMAVTAGSNNWAYIPVGGLSAGSTTCLRFRFSSAGGLAPGGPAPDGEVEDYQITIASEKPSKWLQPPDLSPTGLDVDVRDPRILADDFRCTESGPITFIRIWGSWYKDQVPIGVFQPTLILSIHEDIPAGPNGYSRPGSVLWSSSFDAGMNPGQYIHSPWKENLQEGWYDPVQPFYDPRGDTICWRYDFYVPREQAFIQRGTAEKPAVYWLDVQAIDRTGFPEMYRFGWKTSLHHWSDDAVWGQGKEPFAGPWFELRYPDGHQMERQSIDLAFEIRTEDLDCGDAPDPAYPTLLASSGASHDVVPGICLGAGLDRDPDGQPSADAKGDDNNGIDDEDGVTFLTPLVPGTPAKVDVVASVPGTLTGWIDFNGDGDWNEADEYVFSNPLAGGSNTLSFWVPNTAAGGRDTFARFRFSIISAGIGYTGYAWDGEVEDYKVYIQPTPVVVGKYDAKRLPVGTYVLISDNVVTANFGALATEISHWYFEDPDTALSIGRGAGIGVIPPGGIVAAWGLGDLVSCYGPTRLIGPELVIDEVYSWQVVPGATGAVEPVGQTGRNSGGGPVPPIGPLPIPPSQPGLTDDVGAGKPASGLNTVGLLARLWGRCTYVETDPGDPTAQKNFWIDDGSALWDGTFDPAGNIVRGVKVRIPANMPVPIAAGNYYVVTGIMRAVYDPSGLYPVRYLWPRTAQDIQVIP